jgi:predicted ATPase
LAVHVAAGMADAHPAGVWFVDLAPLTDPALVPQTVLVALGLREAPGQPGTERLAELLRARTLLLVLDNCEHLVDACARLAEALLGACPGLRILATSREPLGLGGELRWRVPPLALPDGDAVDPAAHDAVRLFVDRAAAVRPGFALTPETVPAVAAICRRLDGIPLALELAAARVALLTPGQIAARLDDRFRLLTGGARTALPRQQTLRASLDWSHDLLGAPERALLRESFALHRESAHPAEVAYGLYLCGIRAVRWGDTAQEVRLLGAGVALHPPLAAGLGPAVITDLMRTQRVTTDALLARRPRRCG